MYKIMNKLALQLPSLTYRRKRGDMIQMYKIMDKLFRIDAEKLFTRAKAASSVVTTSEVSKRMRKRMRGRFAFHKEFLTIGTDFRNTLLSPPQSVNSKPV